MNKEPSYKQITDQIKSNSTGVEGMGYPTVLTELDNGEIRPASLTADAVYDGNVKVTLYDFDRYVSRMVPLASVSDKGQEELASRLASTLTRDTHENLNNASETVRGLGAVAFASAERTLSAEQQKMIQTSASRIEQILKNKDDKVLKNMLNRFGETPEDIAHHLHSAEWESDDVQVLLALFERTSTELRDQGVYELHGLDRLHRNDPNNLKSIPIIKEHPYKRPKMTSDEYAAHLAVAKLAGWFNEDKSNRDKIEQQGAHGGQHRQASELILEQFYVKTVNDDASKPDADLEYFEISPEQKEKLAAAIDDLLGLERRFGQTVSETSAARRSNEVKGRFNEAMPLLQQAARTMQEGRPINLDRVQSELEGLIMASNRIVQTLEENGTAARRYGAGIEDFTVTVHRRLDESTQDIIEQDVRRLQQGCEDVFIQNRKDVRMNEEFQQLLRKTQHLLENARYDKYGQQAYGAELNRYVSQLSQAWSNIAGQFNQNATATDSLSRIVQRIAAYTN